MNTDNRAASSGKFQPGVLTDALKTALKRQVHAALEEDVGCADLSAAAAPDKIVTASGVTHDTGILAGKFWFDEVFAQLDSKTDLHISLWGLGLFMQMCWFCIPFIFDSIATATSHRDPL